jgi:hypothetical protein
MGAIVLLPLCVDDAALDRCLAALDAGTAPGPRSGWPMTRRPGRAQAVVEHWLAHTPLQAEYTRRARPLGEVAHLDEMLRACDGLDVAVLAPDSVPAPGWLQQLQDAFARDAAIATATPGAMPARPPRGHGWARSIPSRRTRSCWRTPARRCRRCTRSCHRRSPTRCWCAAARAVAPAAWTWTATLAGTRRWSTSACAWPALAGATCCARPPSSAGQGGGQPRWRSGGPGRALAGLGTALADFLMHDPLHGLRADLQQRMRQAIMPKEQGDLFVPSAPEPPV